MKFNLCLIIIVMACSTYSQKRSLKIDISKIEKKYLALHVDSIFIEGVKLEKFATEENTFFIPESITDTLVPISIFLDELVYNIRLYKKDLLYCHVNNTITLGYAVKRRPFYKKTEYFEFTDCSAKHINGPIVQKTKIKKQKIGM